MLNKISKVSLMYLFDALASVLSSEVYTHKTLTWCQVWGTNPHTLIIFIYKSTKDVPVLPEDAEEISYKETCKENQYEEMTRENNTWNLLYCASPCKNNGPCPRGAQCIGEYSGQTYQYLIMVCYTTRTQSQTFFLYRFE